MRKILFIGLLLSWVLEVHASLPDKIAKIKRECEINGIQYLNAVEFTQYLQDLLKKNDTERILQLMVYPLRVNYRDKNKALHRYIENQAELYELYPEIFNKKMVERILSYSPADIICNAYGAMFEDGILWYTPSSSADFYQLRISTVNMVQ
jgi:hypothetical protein